MKNSMQTPPCNVREKSRNMLNPCSLEDKLIKELRISWYSTIPGQVNSTYYPQSTSMEILEDQLCPQMGPPQKISHTLWIAFCNPAFPLFRRTFRTPLTSSIGSEGYLLYHPELFWWHLMSPCCTQTSLKMRVQQLAKNFWTYETHWYLQQLTFAIWSG